MTSTGKPHYSLKRIKEKVRSEDWRATSNAEQRAWLDFGWDRSDMARCLLKLNARYHLSLPDKNHFYKTEPFNKEPHIMLDFYKARNIMCGEDVYIHLYVRALDDKLIVNSFHQLI
jgi:hypothetical protein